MTASQGASILLVEDDETDILLFKRQASKQGMTQEIHVASDGEKALEFIRLQEPRDGVAPVIVVTDLNMPGLTGHELIEDIRNDPSIAHTIVFVLSTSDLRSDVARAYANGVAGYIVKDPSGGAVVESVAFLKHYQNAITL